MREWKIHLITIYTVCTMLIVVFGGKGLSYYISAKAEETVETSSGNVVDSNGINTSESKILNQLSSIIDTKEFDEKEGTTALLYNTLKNYFENEEVQITKAITTHVTNKINNFKEIIYAEQNTEISKMSLGGKLTSMVLFEQIYELCGLNLLYNLAGTVYGIQDHEGSVLYQQESGASQLPFAYWKMFCLVTVSGALLLIPYLIAHKNHYYQKTRTWSIVANNRKC